MTEPKITYAPYTEIIIHGYSEFETPSELIKSFRQNVVILFWAEEILFSFQPFDRTNLIVQENLAGKIHWNYVHFTRMTEFCSQITEGSIECKVNNVSNDVNFRAVAHYIRNKFAKSRETLASERSAEASGK